MRLEDFPKKKNTTSGSDHQNRLRSVSKKFSGLVSTEHRTTGKPT